MNNISSVLTLRKRPVTLLLSLLLAPAANGLDLQQAYKVAKQHDATFLAAGQRYESSKLDLPLAQSANKVNLIGTGGITQNYDHSSPDVGDSSSSDYQQSQLALSLNKNLYNVSISHNIDAAKIGVEIAGLQLGLAKEALISTVVADYLSVLSALDNEKLAKLERTAIEQQLDLATQRLDVGLGTKTDQYDAQARYESSNAGLIAAQNEVLNAQQSLESLMGQSLGADFKNSLRVLDSQNVNLQIDTSDAWLVAAVEKNLAYTIKQQQIDLQKIELARADNGRTPTLGLVVGASVADAGARSAQPGGGQSNWNVGLQGSIPLYQGGSIKLKQTKAAHALAAVESDAEQARRETDNTIRAARRGVQALQGQVQALALAVRANESGLESKAEGFKAGVTTNLDVLNGQRDLFRARRDHLKASYDLVNAVVQLERVSGGLNDADIARINKWLK